MRAKTGNSKDNGKNQLDSHANNLIPANFVESVRSHSTYLSFLCDKHQAFSQGMLQKDPSEVFANLLKDVEEFELINAKRKDLMSFLRIKKAEVSLLVAAADISEAWNLEQVTHALSDFADMAVTKATEFLLQEAYAAKMLASADINKSGLLMIAVGKQGGRELNYSSDIDLVVLYDPKRTEYTGRSNVRQFFIKLCTDFVAIMQERTADGYVFRVDLRLRPDPYSTPVAISVQAACTYYENVGQNWERAAMIKARLVCGDAESGESYMLFLGSFVWRKYLDFAAINDINSIKRQIDSSAEYSPESLLGYNIKLGKGGIREIEFFAQVQQLIWGGQVPELRQRATCNALQVLEDIGRIKQGAAAELAEIYEFYRDIEHRLQMVADEHTHSLPESSEDLAKFASFMGFSDSAEFEQKLRASIKIVQAYYAELFTDQPSLGAGGNLVFTGVSNDPETLITLSKLGYKDPEKVCEIVRGWHHGRRRSTRFKKVRELLTELTPLILKFFAKTGAPDVAFVKFDAFLASLPSGVQIFTLFNEKPELIKQMADLMGDSPWLADNFSRSPTLVNRILSSDFDGSFFTRPQLFEDVRKAVEVVEESAARIKIIRRWKHDMEFQVGIRLLKKNVEFSEAVRLFSNIAEITIIMVLEEAKQMVDGDVLGEFSIVAMGKLGARELTFGSDLDLVFIYDSSDSKAQKYYINVAKKFTNIMSNLSSDGFLYKVDTRLRPQGEQGNLACSYTAFAKYYAEKAWSWELLALTKARVICGSDKISEIISDEITKIIRSERDAEKLRKDVYEMREKIALSFASDKPWDLKYARGGIFELEFIIQYIILTNSHKSPEIFSASFDDFWHNLSSHSIMSQRRIHELEAAYNFLKRAESVVRLTTKSGFDPANASENQRILVAKYFGEERFEVVQAQLFENLAIVNENFKHMFEDK